MLQLTKTLEFPAQLNKLYKKASYYEWLSTFYMLSVVIFLFLTMGESQTMKTVWFEDMLSLIPPISFLISTHFSTKPATKNFPYGFHKVTGLAFFASALALFITGVYLFLDGSWVLIKGEHPTIGNIYFNNTSVWSGFLMMLALLWKGIPNTFLSYVKEKLAQPLYDKILFTDADMNKADWMTALGGIIGIAGIGLGYWWMDSLIAILISLNIIHDGYQNLSQSILDLIDEVPKTLTQKKNDPLLNEVKKTILNESWISDADVRFRDDGHIFFGEIFIVPKSNTDLVNKIEALRKTICSMHWRLHDIVVMPLPTPHKKTT